MTDYDSPWKESLALYFREFLEFYFPDAPAEIDWSRSHETLDKELQQILREAESGRKIVDHLVKAWLKDGTEEWLLIHIEVQSQADPDFLARLYTCNSRIFDRYQRGVVTLVILADDREGWKPSCYDFARWGFRVRMEFPSVKLLELVRTRTDLETNPNPFAALTLAHMRTQETKDDPEQRRVWKFQLIKSLYQRGLTPQDVSELFRCIDWMMNLPKDLEDRFWDDVIAFEKEKKMPFVDIATRKGIEKGSVKTLVDVILLDWEYRYPDAEEQAKQEIQALSDVALLKQIYRAGKTVASLDELRKLWKPA